MNETLELRPAQPDDAAPASVLLHSAYRHAQTSYPPQDDSNNRFIGYLQHLFREKGNRFSYQNIQVAKQSTNVVGLVLSFGGRDEKQLNAATGWQLQREAEDDEWYVDALAVFTNWGRQGTGTRLMQTAEQQARQQDYGKIALNVAQENTEALSLYQ